MKPWQLATPLGDTRSRESRASFPRCLFTELELGETVFHSSLELRGAVLGLIFARSLAEPQLGDLRFFLRWLPVATDPFQPHDVAEACLCRQKRSCQPALDHCGISPAADTPRWHAYA